MHGRSHAPPPKGGREGVIPASCRAYVGEVSSLSPAPLTAARLAAGPVASPTQGPTGDEARETTDDRHVGKPPEPGHGDLPEERGAIQSVAGTTPGLLPGLRAAQGTLANAVAGHEWADHLGERRRDRCSEQ